MARPILIGCLILVITHVQQPCSAITIMMIKSYFDQAVRLYNDITGPAQGFYALQEGFSVGSNADIMTKLELISTDFQNIGERLFTKMDTLPDELTQKTDQLFEIVKKISRQYDKCLKYLANADKDDIDDLREFAKKVTSSGHGEIRALIPEMHDKLIDLDIKGNGILTIIAKKNPELVCKGMHQSSQQLIRFLYEMVTITSIKGLLTILYGFQIQEQLKKMDVTVPDGSLDQMPAALSKMRMSEIEDVTASINKTYEQVKEVMANASREFWSCDPPIHQRDITYSKLDDIFQGYIVTQYDTHLGFMKLMLSGTRCRQMKPTSLRCLSKSCKDVPEDRRCRGRIRDCQSLDKGMSICPAPRNSSHRYDSIQLESSGLTFGPKKSDHSSCYDPYILRRALLYGDHCLCNCESEKQEKTRYFSLLDVTSDVNQNKIVTGARLVRKGYVFYIEVQQGTLGPNGTIVEEPSEWVTVPEISNSTLLSSEVSVFHHDPTTYWEFVAGQDTYPYVDWTDFRQNKLVHAVTYDTNAILLDDLEGSPDGVLTGLRFQRADNDLRLEIQTTSYDYESGTLKPGSSSWSFNSATRKERKETKLERPDEPIKIEGSEEVSKPGTYVRFTISSVESDLGQNTVPYIDVQDVVPNQVTPLAGAGLYLRGKAGSDGFLALKVIHVDYTSHLSKIQ